MSLDEANGTLTAATPEAAAAERVARQALSARSATRSLASLPLTPIRGGLSNHAWRVDQGGRRYFVRIGGADSERLGVDRNSECVLLEAVSAAGLAPEVLACDPSNGLLVTRFVDGAPLRRESTQEPRLLRRLGEILRVLHRLPRPAGVREVSFVEQARLLESQLASTGGIDPRLASAAESGFRRLAGRRGRLALCHNDLHHLNILDHDDGLWLVDWEYGGWGDPVFDLASFVSQHALPAGRRSVLLEAYGDPSIAGATLAAACIAFDYVQWLWYRLWIARNPEADGEYSARADALAARIAPAKR
jgi:thiamine kinase-like enzyme